ENCMKRSVGAVSPASRPVRGLMRLCSRTRASGLAPPKVKATPVSSPRSEAPRMGPDPVPSKKWEPYGGYDPKSRAATADRRVREGDLATACCCTTNHEAL
ncbi:MAG: hypothetical protein ACK55Z_14800, partial [bacterium]